MSALPPEEIARRADEVRRRIRAAAERSGRDPDGIRLVAATKLVPPDAVAAAVAAGVTDLGENRAQELVRKQDALRADPRASGARWHFIGVLQRNKVRTVAGRVALIHSVASPDLARAVSARAAGGAFEQAVLLEVNIAGEDTKAGVSPDDAAGAAAEVAAMPALRLRGLMTMTPFARDAEDLRPLFGAARRLRDAIAETVPEVRELSMGMSGDYEIAIEEGATMVRIGTALFGSRGERA